MVLETCIQAAKANRRTIVLPEGDDERIQAAAWRAAAGRPGRESS